MKLPEKLKKMTIDEQREWVRIQMKKAEAKFLFLKKISSKLALPGGRLKLEDYDRPDLEQLKNG